MSAPQELTDREIVLRLALDVMRWRVREPGGPGLRDMLVIKSPSRAVRVWFSNCSNDDSRWNPLESHDAGAEVLAKLPEDQRATYQIELGTLVGVGDEKDRYEFFWLMLTATPRQKCLAILRAMEGGAK